MKAAVCSSTTWKSNTTTIHWTWCGYGPLGLTLARLAPDGTSVLIDKDFVAVEYSKKNAQINNIKNVEIFLSNGFDQIGKRKFDLIVSNLPAKTGKELYYSIFTMPWYV